MMTIQNLAEHSTLLETAVALADALQDDETR